MDEKDLLDYLIDFVCQKGLWNDFISFMKEKGYTEEELEDL